MRQHCIKELRQCWKARARSHVDRQHCAVGRCGVAAVHVAVSDKGRQGQPRARIPEPVSQTQGLRLHTDPEASSNVVT